VDAFLDDLELRTEDRAAAITQVRMEVSGILHHRLTV
jgi:hypothetical protein